MPSSVVICVAGAGAVVVAWFVVLSIVHWPSVSGFADRPSSGGALVMDACYVPAAFWPVLLVAALIAFLRRRRATTGH